MLRPDNVFLAVKPVDMRRGIDTLTQYIQDELKWAPPLLRITTHRDHLITLPKYG